MPQHLARRSFLQRVLGWSDSTTIDQAERTLDIARDHFTSVVFHSSFDVPGVARRLQYLTLGVQSPFVIADRRRGLPSSHPGRSPNRLVSEDARRALELAAGGTLYVRTRSLPTGFNDVINELRNPVNNVRLMICGSVNMYNDIYTIMPASILVPDLGVRSNDIPRIIDEYADDAASQLGSVLADSRRELIHQYSANTLDEIEKATLRILAFDIVGNMAGAAARVGMAACSLQRWLDRRHVRFQSTKPGGPHTGVGQRSRVETTGPITPAPVETPAQNNPLTGPVAVLSNSVTEPQPAYEPLTART